MLADSQWKEASRDPASCWAGQGLEGLGGGPGAAVFPERSSGAVHEGEVGTESTPSHERC